MVPDRDRRPVPARPVPGREPPEHRADVAARLRGDRGDPRHRAAPRGRRDVPADGRLVPGLHPRVARHHLREVLAAAADRGRDRHRGPRLQPRGRPLPGRDPGKATRDVRVLGGVIIPGRTITARVIFGLTVITLGVLFTLDNLGLVDSGEVLRWWPAVLIAYGVARLAGIGGPMNLSAGLLFTVGGSWMLLHNLGLISVGIGQLWPLLLVMVGVAMVAGGMRRARTPTRKPNGGAGGHLHAFAVWSR